MAENEKPSIVESLSFDNWRVLINLVMNNPDDYRALKKSKNIDILGLTLASDNVGILGSNLAKEFPGVVDQHLKGFEESSLVAKDVRNALEFARDICPDPWKAAFVIWCKESKELPELIAKAKENPEKFSYHGFIGDLCEAYGNALAAGPHGVTSPYYKPEAPNAVQYKARLADGSWQDISQADLIALARKPDGPHIVHSANHAFLDNTAIDLDSLQDEFSKLFDGSRLPVQGADQGHLSAWDSKNLGPNDTITVFATHTQQNRFLNLAQLFHRLDEVDSKQDKPREDIFEHAAPIAIDMVETLLKSIVVDGDVEKIHAHRDAAGKPIFFDAPVTLRPDAIDIIRRQRYRGFSKGGNDFRDAMRLLVHTLDAKDAAQAPMVAMPEGINTRNLISNMSVIVFGLNEKPMADYYREHGVNVPIISSKNDITAPPSVKHEADEPAYNYVGGTKNGDDGHSPTYSVAGMLADWRTHDLLKMHGAISQGQAAITDVNFVKASNGSYYHNVLSLELAHGTSDAMMNKVMEPLNKALQAQEGLEHVRIRRVGNSQGRARYELRGEGLVSQDNIKSLQNVFRTLCAEHELSDEKISEKHPAVPLWVSQSAAYGKLSLMRRYLKDEKNEKIDPSAVIEAATVTPYVQLDNVRGWRAHPRTLRNTEHPRIAQPADDDRQIG